MLTKDDQVRLRHMLDAARTAVGLAAGRSRADLEDQNDPLVHALVRLVSVIGEAAGKLSPAGQSELNEVRWPDLIGMRHRLIHDYFDINLDILWATVQVSLPDLIKNLEAALPESDED